jgi:hypothetical protein
MQYQSESLWWKGLACHVTAMVVFLKLVSATCINIFSVMHILNNLSIIKYSKVSGPNQGYTIDQMISRPLQQVVFDCSGIED